MNTNYLQSATSTNETKGHAVSGLMLTAEISEYSVAFHEPEFATVVLRQYAGRELINAVQVSIEGLYDFMESGNDKGRHKTVWPRGDEDIWNFRRYERMVEIIAKCHTGGRIVLYEGDARYLAEACYKTAHETWEANVEARAESEKRRAEREKERQVQKSA